EIDAQNAHALPVQLLLEGIELGNLLATRRAPFRPVVDDQPPPLEAVRTHDLAMLIEAQVAVGTTDQAQAEHNHQNDSCQSAHLFLSVSPFVEPRNQSARLPLKIRVRSA